MSSFEIISIDRATLVGRLRERLAGRTDAAAMMEGMLRQMLETGEPEIGRHEFSAALTSLGLRLNRLELEECILHFGRHSGTKVAFDDFLISLQSRLSPRRHAIVAKLFRELDQPNSGQISFSDLAVRFKPSGHPKCKSGELAESTVLHEFLAEFESTQGPNFTGVLTYAGLDRYFTAVARAITDEQSFLLMMSQLWGVTSDAPTMTPPLIR